jgi:hypothetical protein
VTFGPSTAITHGCLVGPHLAGLVLPATSMSQPRWRPPSSPQPVSPVGQPHLAGDRQPATSLRNPGLAWPFSLPICIDAGLVSRPCSKPSTSLATNSLRPRHDTQTLPVTSEHAYVQCLAGLTSHHVANQLSVSTSLAPHTHLAEKPVSAISSLRIVENTDPCCNDSQGRSLLRPRRPVSLPSISVARFAVDLGPPANGFTDH